MSKKNPREIKNYNELNEYTIYRNLYSIAKAVLRGKFILLNASITEGGTLVSQKLEEEEWFKAKERIKLQKQPENNREISMKVIDFQPD